MTYFLNLRASAVGGILAAGVFAWNDTLYIEPSRLAEEARGRDVLLVTHGFNVSLPDGISSLQNWERLLTLNSNTLFIGVLWPGDSRWAPVVDYPFEGDEAIGAGKMLAPFIDAWLKDATSISFVSHSLGARFVLETIRWMQERARRVVLMAGAIDDTCLTGEYAKAASKIDELSILASRDDHVLSLAFPIGNFLAGIVTRGSPYWRAALGREGPSSGAIPCLKGPWQIPDAWQFDHGSYLPHVPTQQVFLVPTNLPPPPPAPLAPLPITFPASQPSWTAGFCSTRLA